eukprot:TRINITY_DN2746_c0_g1_i1.p1 TRINITY_DN2746_c0_g1~~TRINITY_DN2746_c0_g1_i1.p1  ORF type:complete len:712 (-),score=173.70 TRINITY_DN2746_c0_g1_i1:80-2215(-)
MVAALPQARSTKPPANIEEFLWNLHSVLVAPPGRLPLDNLKDAYSKHLGHKCVVEKFLVVSDGGLAATLKRIPHIVTLVRVDGTICVEATQPATSDKKDLIEADQRYRRDLANKHALAKTAQAAANVAKAKATTPGEKAAPVAATVGGAAAPTVETAGARRPAENAAAGAPAAKQAKTGDSDAETLARMLVQGVVRVLQHRLKNGKGPLPLAELDEEFTALWKVPFNLEQAGETDAETFLAKWPNKVELTRNGNECLVILKKGSDKQKLATAAVKAPAPSPAVEAKASPPVVEVAPAAPPVAVANVAPRPEDAKNVASGPAIPKRAGGPVRPPSNVEDFLWNIHCVIEAFDGPLPVDQLKEAYSKHLGHRCAIERFLVVKDGELPATLKRIPHVVSVNQGTDGSYFLLRTLPPGTTREQLVAADQEYRRQLQKKNPAAKPAAPKPPTPSGPTPVAATTTPMPSVPVAATVTPTSAPAPVAAAVPVAASVAKPTVPAAAVARPAEVESPEAKKQRTAETDTLAKMLIQGVVRVLQNRAKESKGPLLISNLKEEFKAQWKVSFNLEQAGETDMLTFLNKWSHKVEVITIDGGLAVQLAKKTASKAALPAVATQPAPAAPAAPVASTPAEPKAVAAVAPVVTQPAISSGVAPEPAGASEKIAAAVAPAKEIVADGEAAKTISEFEKEAREMLEEMRRLTSRQEAFVNALARASV